MPEIPWWLELILNNSGIGGGNAPGTPPGGWGGGGIPGSNTGYNPNAGGGGGFGGYSGGTLYSDEWANAEPPSDEDNVIIEGLDKAKSTLGNIAGWAWDNREWLLTGGLQYLSNKDKNDAMNAILSQQQQAFDWDVAQKQQMWESLAPIREKATPYFESIMSGQNPMMDMLRKYQGADTFSGGGDEYRSSLDAEGNATMGRVNPPETKPFDMGALTEGLSPTRTSGEFKGLYDDLLKQALGRRMFEAKPFEASPMANYSLLGNPQQPPAGGLPPPNPDIASGGAREYSPPTGTMSYAMPGGKPQDIYGDIMKKLLGGGI